MLIVITSVSKPEEFNYVQRMQKVNCERLTSSYEFYLTCSKNVAKRTRKRLHGTSAVNSTIDRAKRDWQQNRPRITIRVAPALLEAVYFNVGRQPRVKHRLGMVEETTDCLTVSITILLLILDFISMLEAICDPGHYLVRQS